MSRDTTINSGNPESPRRALVLSGGGSRGGYEIGVWQAMKELGMDIDIVTGTSVGAINAAMVCVGDLKLAKKLWRDVETNMVFDLDNESRYDEAKEEIVKNTRGFMGMPVAEALSYAKYTVTRGGAGSSGLLGIMQDNLDVEAFYDSPVEYGLVTAELPAFKGRFLYKEDIPEDKICEYLVASASCFPAAHFTVIDGKKLVDGGYSDNLPIDMAIEKGATQIVAVNMEAIGVVKKESLKRAEELPGGFTYITSKWDLGNFLCFDPETNRRNMALGYLDALKAFGQKDGIWYTFEKGCIPSKAIRRADCAARIFDLDPLNIYTRQKNSDLSGAGVSGSAVSENDPAASLSNDPTDIPTADLNEELTAAVRTAEKQYLKSKELLEKRASKLLSGSITSGITRTLRSTLSPQVLTVIIAHDFKEKEGQSAFLNKHFISRFSSEVLAASYIKGEGLISDDLV